MKSKVVSYLSSVWINMLFIVLGIYCFLLIRAFIDLYGDDRGLTFETVVLERFGGALVYTISYIIDEQLIPFLTYIGLLILTSIAVFNVMRKAALSKALFFETIVVSSAIAIYLFSAKNYEMLFLIVVLWLSQFIRYKKLFKKYGSYLP